MLTNLYVLYFISLVVPSVSTGSLTVQITALENQRGSVRAALYSNEEAFDNQKTDRAMGRIRSELSGSTCTFSWADLPYGVYALAIYHDVNDNGELDTNVFGIPTEPYAFSNKPSVKWRSPRFSEVAFQIEMPDTSLVVALSRWSDR